MMPGHEAKAAPRPSLVPEDADGPSDESYLLKLYVAGQTPKSLAAIANLRRICSDHLPEGSAIEIIDLAVSPEFAARDQIVALPTLIRRRPEPIRRLIGALADTQKVLDGLELSRAAR